jgi:hypothetical protein
MHDHHHHAIQLGAAWEPPSPAAADGRVVWTRRFGRPAGLGPGDRVLLVVSQPSIAGEMVVNAVALPRLAAGASRWAEDITPLLQDRNELRVAVAAASTIDHAPARGPHGRGPLPSVIGIVALEIVPADDGTSGPATA